MPPSKSFIETIVLNLKDGTDSENVPIGAGQAFGKLTNTLKAQHGFISQFYGPQIENPNIFVWYIEWESPKNHATFANSKESKIFTDGLGQVFDLEKAAPLMIYSRIGPNATAALKSETTEVSFSTVPKGCNKEEKTKLDEVREPFMDAIMKVGKLRGYGTGWVYKVIPNGAAANDGEDLAWHGIFGFASVEDHMEMRTIPEIAEAAQDTFKVSKQMKLRPSTVPGNDEEGMFHVHFRAGT